MGEEEFDKFLIEADGNTLDFFGIQVNKLEFFKKYFAVDYEAMKQAYIDGLLDRRRGLKLVAV